MHESYSAHRLLATLAGEGEQHGSDYERIRAAWRSRWGEQDFDRRWRQVLFDGVIADMAPKAVTKPGAKFPGWTPTPSHGGMSAIFRTDPSAFDGRFANNAWLQECPQPFSKAVWGNAVEMAPEDANRLGIKEGDEVEIRSGAHSLFGPMRLSNGLAPGVLQLSLGYSRKRAGAIGDDVGFNVALLRTTSSPWLSEGMSVRRIGSSGRLSPATAGLFALEGKAEELAPESEVGANAKLLPALADPKRRPLRVGDGHRPGRLHRLQRLRRRLPVGRERACDRAGRNRPGPRHALAQDRGLRSRRSSRPAAAVSAGALHAVRGGALRARLSGRSVGARSRGAQRPGL